MSQTSTGLGRTGRKWLKKSAVAERYSCVPRSVMNMVADGRLPRPKFPVGGNIPLWLESELDEHDKRATVERPAKKAAKQSETAAA